MVFKIHMNTIMLMRMFFCEFSAAHLFKSDALFLSVSYQLTNGKSNKRL